MQINAVKGVISLSLFLVNVGVRVEGLLTDYNHENKGGGSIVFSRVCYVVRWGINKNASTIRCH